MNITNINESLRAIYRTQKNKFQMKTDINNQIFSFSLNRLSQLVIEKKTVFSVKSDIWLCLLHGWKGTKTIQSQRPEKNT